MSIRNIIVQLRNVSAGTITLGTLSIAPAASVTIWDTETFATGIADNFEQVIAGIAVFNQNIGNGNLVMVVDSVDQSAANAWIQYHDLVRVYKEESIRNDFDVLRLLRLYATTSASGLLSSDEYNKIGQLDGYNISELFNTTGEISGFPSRTTSTISVNNATREFTIAPVSGSYDIYINSHKVTKSTSDTVTFTDTEGLHYFYFNKSGTLIHTTLSSEFGAVIQGNGVLVSVIYWDTDSNVQILLGDERHGFMDGKTHYHLHNAFGAQWYDGGALGDITADGNGASATHVQLSASHVTFADEDIVFKSIESSQVLSFPAQIPIYYRSGADGYWRRKTPDVYPMIYNGTAGYSGTYVPYNQWTGSTWQLTSVSSGSFVLIHFFAGNDKTYPIFGVQGQVEYQSIGDARTGASNEIATLAGTAQLLSPEFVRLGSIIVQVSVSYTNVPKARIRTTDTGTSYIDFRGSSVRGVGATVADHGNLSGLTDDDHQQYLLVNGTRAMTGSLNMGTYNITNVGTVDGYNLETEFARISSGVTGPGSSTDNSVARFDGTTGKVIQNSAVTISDTAVIDGVNSISLDLQGTPPAWQEGLIWYDSDAHSLVAYNDKSDVVHQLGQELFMRAVNNTGVSIPNGSVVYVSGAQGNRPTIALAQANDSRKVLAVGIVTHTVPNNEEGLVTIKGSVNGGVDTSTFTTGDYLYVSPSIPGGLTNIKPSGVDYAWFVGVALNSTNNGSVVVSTQGPFKLTDLHDVDGINSPLDGYYFRGNGSFWEGRVFSNDVLSLANVLGASSSTDNALARFDLTTGKLLQNSLAILDDSGNLNLNAGTGTITCGNINSVSITAHASRHNPGGADALTTAAPSTTAVQIGNTAAVGTATSFSRSDHVHTVTGGTPVNVTKAANADGTATTFARSDHKHDVTTAAASSLTGTSTNTEGSATSLARSDHTHNISSILSGTAPVDVTKSTAAAGTATTAARQDHKHNVSTAAASSLTGTSTSTEGTATSLARSDHTHSISGILSSTAPVNVTKATAAAGTATESARQDHKHDVTTAAAVSVGTTNAEGTSTSLARADHTHAVTGLSITSEAQGDILYRNATAWVRLPASTSGQYLQTQGAAANPQWSDGYFLTLNYTPISYSVVSNNIGQHIAGLDTKLNSLNVGPSYVFDSYDATGGTDITATATVPLDTQRVKDSIYTHSTSTNNGQVTVTAAGRYEITYNVGTQVTSGSTISASECWLEVNSAEVSGSRGVMLNSQTTYGGTHVSRTIELTLAANSVLRIRAVRTAGTNSVSLKANTSSLVIRNVTAVNASTTTPTAHASTHILNGTDEIDGDTIGITWAPTNYTRTTTPQSSSTSHLTSHLAGIDAAIATKVTGAASSTDNAIVRFDATTGKLIQNSNVIITDDGYVQQARTVTFNAWPTVTASTDGYAEAEYGANQKITINLNNKAAVTITLNEPSGPGNFMLILKQGSTTPTTSITWATEGTHALYAPSGTLGFASTTSSRTMIGLAYDGTDWYAVSSQPMQQVIAS